ncbi:DUF4194 domain-containing protein [Gloeothece verrucosa]|uniref:DUF4194 domain-containing protein n=1 Tax=Gloeothece verrucosa (strain PCC 7822) TaxID=497965 RepID=E0U8N0_GLOV7|nr:DUF4194 domain-containing protein [Gloeothece verrucosa]ADN13776.1 conserved hypothetical protein [Gloeothece verrucosa PCC 7822]
MLPQSTLPYAPAILKLLQGAMYSDDVHWNQLQTYLTAIQKYFAQIGLEVRNHETDGFAYLEQPDPDPQDKSEPLPRLTRRNPLTFRVTLLCVLLREEWRKFDTNSTTGQLVLNIEKIREMLKLYLPDGNNEDRLRLEVERLVGKVRELGFLRRLSQEDESYQVLPILKAKIDADQLALLKQKLEAYATSSPD